MSYLLHRRKAFQAGGAGGTDWTANANFRALWNFESGAFKTDSHSTNDFEASPTNLGDPTANTSDYKQGSQSADFEDSGSPDSGLVLNLSTGAASDFPWNGTGTAEVTIGGWLRSEQLGSHYIFSVNNATQRMNLNSGGTITVKIDGSGTRTYTTTATIAIDTWYFVAYVYSDSGDELACYISTAGGSSVFETDPATTHGTLDDGGSSDFCLGARYDGTSANCWDGELDHWGVIEQALTQSELDGVRDNGWDGGGLP